MALFEKQVKGMEEYDEAVNVLAFLSNNSVSDAEDGLAVIDVQVQSAGESLYATLSIAQAEEHIKHVREAIDALTS